MPIRSAVLALMMSLAAATSAAAQATPIPPTGVPPVAPPPPGPPTATPVAPFPVLRATVPRVPTTPPTPPPPPSPHVTPPAGRPLPGQRTPLPQRTQPPTPKAPALVSPQAKSTSMENIRVDITIIDNAAGGETRKTLSMLLREGHNGQIRSTGLEGGIINIDALPRTGAGDISLNLTIEYLPEQGGQTAQNGLARPVRYGMLTQSITVVLADGKPTVVTQSADPRTDRRVTVEVTATTLK